MTNKGKKLKRYKVYLGKRCLGGQLAFSKANALKNVRKHWGPRVRVRQVKY